MTEAATMPDFSLPDEYKPTPLVPAGNYFANVVSVDYNPDQNKIVWRLALDGNEGMLNDGVSSVNGVQLFYNNWLPRPGDEAIPSNKAGFTKRDMKISMLKTFSNNMKINMDTAEKVVESISNATWVGLRVIARITIKPPDDFNAEYTNEVRNLFNGEEE